MVERESISPKYVGAYYVKFRECQLAFFNPALKRLGPSSLTNLGAMKDRVYRSLMVFNAWIKNYDAKDSNSVAGLLYNSQTGRFGRTMEYQFDMGYALGTLGLKGQLNCVEKSMLTSALGNIFFLVRPGLLPKPWEICTWADARWMALRIAALSRTDLEQCFNDCGWPAFVQKIAVEKLLSRRNDLVKTFSLEEDGVKLVPCNPEFSLSVQHKGAKDDPVIEGRINRDSTTVQELETVSHPESLTRTLLDAGKELIRGK